MTDEWIQTISNRYIQLFEQVTGMQFQPQSLSESELRNTIVAELNRLGIF